MIKPLILTGILAGTLTYNVTDAFEMTRLSVHRILNVYSAAASIRPHEATRQDLAVQQASLFESARSLGPLADIALKTEDASMERGQQIFDQYRVAMITQ